MISPSYQITCAFCGRSMDRFDLKAGYQQALCWASLKKREQGGNHTYVLPEYKHSWAHDYCVDAAKAGVVGQRSMF